VCSSDLPLNEAFAASVVPGPLASNQRVNDKSDRAHVMKHWVDVHDWLSLRCEEGFLLQYV